jgi:hypothetical protein
VLYPDVLGTYGDGGNAVVLAQRLRWRGLAAEIVQASLGSPVPASASVYLLGGGEDAPQALAAAELRHHGVLGRAVEGGAAVLVVCAGLQVVGSRFLAAGSVHEGVGLVDASTVAALPRRAVGELVVDGGETGLPVLSGYENHAGATVLGPGVVPLGRVRSGIGNGAAGVDGFVAGRVVGTYLHGPALARNPALADLVLTLALGPLPPGNDELRAADEDAGDLRAERLAVGAEGGGAPASGWRGRAVAVSRRVERLARGRRQRGDR